MLFVPDPLEHAIGRPVRTSTHSRLIGFMGACHAEFSLLNSVATQNNHRRHSRQPYDLVIDQLRRVRVNVVVTP